MNAEKLPPITAEDIIGLDFFHDVIESIIERVIKEEKSRCGRTWLRSDFNIKPEDYLQDIQEFLDSYSEFENENVAAEEWLQCGGYDLIERDCYL